MAQASVTVQDNVLIGDSSLIVQQQDDAAGVVVRGCVFIAD